MAHPLLWAFRRGILSSSISSPLSSTYNGYKCTSLNGFIQTQLSSETLFEYYCYNSCVLIRTYVRSTSRLDTSADPSSSTSYAFDRNLKRMQRDNAGRAQLKWRKRQREQQQQQKSNNNNNINVENHQYNGMVVEYDYFLEEITARLVDRLDDITRPEGFPLALDLGCGPSHVHRAICSDDFIPLDDDENNNDIKSVVRGGIGGVRKLVQIDSSPIMLHRDDDNNGENGTGIPVDGSHRCETYKLLVDNYEDDNPLPFPSNSFDLVISSGSLHWVNNLPRLFQEVSRVLKPDGCFMLAMVGGTTLSELRACFVMAELERMGGVSPHVGPFVGLSDVGSLLQRAGFALPTIDIDTITLSFPDCAVLMEHLQRMGENNASIKRKTTISKDVLLSASCLYDYMFPLHVDDSITLSTSEIEVTVQVIYAIGWKPHESQQQPKQRGTATHRVGEIVVDKTKA